MATGKESPMEILVSVGGSSGRRSGVVWSSEVVLAGKGFRLPRGVVNSKVGRRCAKADLDWVRNFFFGGGRSLLSLASSENYAVDSVNWIQDVGDECRRVSGGFCSVAVSMGCENGEASKRAGLC